MMDDYNPETLKVMSDLSFAICSLSNGESSISSNLVQKALLEFVKTMPNDDVDLAASRVNKFTFSCVPVALVQQYLSPDEGIKEGIKQSVQTFVNAIRSLLPEPISSQCVPIVLELCTLFRRYAANDDDLYKFCRSSLAEMVNRAEKFRISGYSTLQDTYPFGSSEFVSKISDGLVSSMEPVNGPGPTLSDVDHFRAFLRPLMFLIKDQLSLPLRMPVTCKFANIRNIVRFFHDLFVDLLMKLLMCLDTMEDLMKEKKENSGSSQYLMILNELHDISKLYEGREEEFLKNLRDKKVSLCHLIVKYAERDEDYEWILEHKDLTNFESRRRLIMLLLPEVNEEHDDLHEMLIDRSQLLAESFECIAHADPDCLRVGLAIEFENEEATGFGVLREWFFLVCQEIFNPKNGFFVACPNDCRRFFPKEASKDPKHLQYYNFTGRVIALALMHQVQVGINFDRSFLLLLAGNKVSLEDIKDADPFLYSSCHQILEMDPMEIDQDTLGLTFVWDIQESGFMKVAELCPGGKNISVNSRNRDAYVRLLIRYRFMTCISEQTAHFAQGFTDIVGEERIQKICFRCLEVKDFDRMLYGSESDIDVQDWKKHTGYRHGYLESDPHICWFWEIVEKMSAKQQKVLLFFWTSITHLPVEGFCGLPSRLKIYKSVESIHHLPSSHTCFYQLCIPAYPSMSVMQERLNIITQDHVGYSFGIN